MHIIQVKPMVRGMIPGLERYSSIVVYAIINTISVSSGNRKIDINDSTHQHNTFPPSSSPAG